MKHSPLQLIRYFAPKLSVLANESFNEDKPWECGVEEFSVEAVVNRQTVPKDFPGHSWTVEMMITQKIKKGQNCPYQLNLTLVGVFACRDGALPDDKENQFVRVNGSSMLYGAARELIRSVTAVAPWGEMILPTISFYDKATNETKESVPISKEEG